jgi:hypothetical protein
MHKRAHCKSQRAKASASAGAGRPEHWMRYPAMPGNFSIHARAGESPRVDATARSASTEHGVVRLAAWPLHRLLPSRRTRCLCGTHSLAARRWPCCSGACANRTPASRLCAACCRTPWHCTCGQVRSTPTVGLCWPPTAPLLRSCASCSPAWTLRCSTVAGPKAPSRSRFKRAEPFHPRSSALEHLASDLIRSVNSRSLPSAWDRSGPGSG